MQALQPANRPTSSPAEDVITFRRLLKADGLWPAMRFLNGLSPYRYSAVFRFEGSVLRNVCFVSREEPELTSCPELPVADSYCVYVQESGSEFGVEHACLDRRVVGHPKAAVFQSYYGVPLIAADGRLVGTACHFDELPVVLQPGVSALLNDVSDHIAQMVDLTA